MAVAGEPRAREKNLVRRSRREDLPAGQRFQFRRHHSPLRGRHDCRRNARKTVETVGNRDLRHLDPQRQGLLQGPRARCRVGHERPEPAYSGRLFLRRENRRRGRAQLRRGRFALDRRGLQHRKLGIRHRDTPAGLRAGGHAALFPAVARRHGRGRPPVGRHPPARQHGTPAFAHDRGYGFAGGLRPARPAAAARGGRRYAGCKTRRGRSGQNALRIRPHLCFGTLGAVRNDTRRQQSRRSDEIPGGRNRFADRRFRLCGSESRSGSSPRPGGRNHGVRRRGKRDAESDAPDRRPRNHERPRHGARPDDAPPVRIYRLGNPHAQPRFRPPRSATA